MSPKNTTSGSVSITLSVPSVFPLPSVYTTASPGVVAEVLTLGATSHALARQTLGDHQRNELEQEHKRQTDQLRDMLITEQRQRATLEHDLQRARASTANAAQSMVEPLITAATSRIDASYAQLVETLTAQVADLRAQLDAVRRDERAVRDVHTLCTQQFERITNSNRIKQTIGEEHVLPQIALLCPDSTVANIADERKQAKSGDGLWTRCFGSATMSMKCMVEVKNVDRMRTEELTSFHEHLDRRLAAGAVNCGMFVSLQPVSLPATNGRPKYSAYFTLDWRRSVPVLYVSNLNSNPDLLGICVAMMQQIWQYCDRVGSLGVEGGDNDDLEAIAHVINTFVNEQYALHRQQAVDLQETADHLIRMTRDNDRRIALHREQADTIANRLVDALGTVVRLTPPENQKEIRKRRRTATAIDARDMTPQQRKIVDQCLAYVATGAPLKSASVNAGAIEGVRKHDVDSLFGNFASLKKTVEGMAAPS
jgi:hypothetical protein